MITEPDRQALIRLASTLPVGSDARKVILAHLPAARVVLAMEHANEKAKKKYFAEHPNMTDEQKSKHTVAVIDVEGHRQKELAKNKSNYKKLKGDNAALTGEAALKVLKDKEVKLSVKVRNEVKDGKTIAQALQSEAYNLARYSPRQQLSDYWANTLAGALRALEIEFDEGTERSALLRLASTLPVGSPARKGILAGLQARTAE